MQETIVGSLESSDLGLKNRSEKQKILRFFDEIVQEYNELWFTTFFSRIIFCC